MHQEEKQKGLSEDEVEEVENSASLSSPQIFEVVRREGLAELHRPSASLFWSGLAAGLALSLSVYCQGFFKQALGDHALVNVITPLGYTVGFLIVVIGRLQLFTENTITVVLPLLESFAWHRLRQAMRLWGIVFGANLLGTFCSAFAVLHWDLFPAKHTESFLEVSRHLIGLSVRECLFLGIPSGFLIAAMVWLVASARTSGFGVVLILSYFISLGGMTHVIAGSTEYFLLSLNGEMAWSQSLLRGLAPTLLGNIIGGSLLFALFSYGQVREEISRDRSKAGT